jgi:hypothetical protein
MSMGIGHFAAGAGAAYFVLNLLPPKIRRKVPDYGSLAIMAGLWAMIPDLSKFSSRLNDLHDSFWSNLFFLHNLMDRLDVNDSVWISAIVVGFMIVMMLTLLANEFWRRKNIK